MTLAEPAPPWLFYFDFISPYAFLAWTQMSRIRLIAERHEGGARTVEAVPILFAALLGAHGTKGPAEVPAKRRYLARDVARKAVRFGVPEMRPPPAHPFHPLTALRVASVAVDTPTRERIIDVLFRAAWVHRQAIDSPEAVASVLSEAGLDAEALLAGAAAPETKALVRARTEEALAKGVFGVPTLDVDGELFWGTDTLDDLELVAQGKVPPTPPEWANLPVGASRNA